MEWLGSDLTGSRITARPWGIVLLIILLSSTRVQQHLLYLLQSIPEIPDDLKQLYKTVWEISQKTVLKMAAERGAFIDQSQSLNIHIAEPNYGKLTSMHFYGWKQVGGGSQPTQNTLELEQRFIFQLPIKYCHLEVLSL